MAHSLKAACIISVTEAAIRKANAPGEALLWAVDLRQPVAPVQVRSDRHGDARGEPEIEQRVDKRAAVHGYERTGRLRAKVVDGPGYGLLPRPRFAGDQFRVLAFATIGSSDTTPWAAGAFPIGVPPP